MSTDPRVLRAGCLTLAVVGLLAFPAPSSAQWLLTKNFGADTFPHAINDLGHVVGSSAGAPFVWTPQSGIQHILGSVSGQAHDINNHGDVVGTTESGHFLWTAAQGHVDLGNFIPAAINNAGVIAGTCLNPGVGFRACVWSAGVVTAIDVPGTRAGGAYGINDAGEVVGLADGEGFVYTSDGVHMLEIPARFELYDVRVVAINNRGQIAGSFGNRALAVWDTTGALRHFSPERDEDAHDLEFTVAAINDRGVVVGGKSGLGLRALAWTPGAEITYFSEPMASWGAVDINVHGDAVGTAQLEAGSFDFGVLWRYQPAGLHITTPNTPSHWGIKTRQRIAWTYAGSATHFEITVYRDGNPELIDIVSNNPGHSQNYYWTVSGPDHASARVSVRAVGHYGADDFNDAGIRIAPAAIQMILPSARTVAPFGATQTVSWIHNLGARAPIAVDVSQDGGTSWRTVVQTATKGSTTSTFRWNVDLPPTSRARIRVRGLDGSGAIALSPLFAVRARPAARSSAQ